MKKALKKAQSQLLYRVNPLAAGMTECERGRCRTKSRLAGWTHILGTDAQNMSQWTRDQRRRAASDVGSRCLFKPPPTPFSLLVVISPLFFSFLLFYFLFGD